MNLAERIAQITLAATARIEECLVAAIEESTTDESDIAFDLYRKREEYDDGEDRWNFMLAFETGRRYGAMEERHASLGLDS